MRLWAQNNGGSKFLKLRIKHNFDVFVQWINRQEWCKFLAHDSQTRSFSTHCFIISEEWFQALNQTDQWQFMETVGKLLSDKNMVYDCINHRQSIPSFRLWGGPTINTVDLDAALNCVKWAYYHCRDEFLNSNPAS